MRQAELLDAVRGAVVHLEWLAADRYRGALALLAKTPVGPVDHEPGGQGGGSGGRRSSGSHSDPTGEAVCAGADRQARLAERADAIVDTARWIRQTVAGRALPAAPGTLAGAAGDLEWVTVVPHLITAHHPATPEARAELHHAVDLVYREAAALQAEVEVALRYSATVAAGRPAQKPRRTCRSCRRAERTVDIYVDRYADLCRSCGDYKRAAGRLPTIPYVEYVYQRGRRPPAALEQRWLAEEKIPSKQRRRLSA